ncbi:P-loop NTPase family protein [Tautonia sociabilis]|uniref:AAA family ATPase n=1 Tax=Tautonia sociabilis TaxID=2080755 RepID=A0A432MJI9_9BACT|nr:AAA family ATPase [Tautonia sociabilis]RUL87345.1 AAA family ATPase [Tautonia sociabilis]
MSIATSPLPPTEAKEAAPFRPKAVTDFASAGLNPALIESLVLKYLLGVGVASGRKVAHELGLPFGPFPEFLRGLKAQQIVTYTDAAAANDYHFSLTDAGRARARGYLEECAYVGTAPVPFADYVASVEAQSIATENPKEADLRRAFSDLLISEDMFRMLGPAINSGKGLFLYGYPGNGKTSIAERITRCFGTTVWIPRTILVEGQILKLFDPANHEPIENVRSSLLREDDQDDRWVEIKRPTIVAGGELTMEALEIYYDRDNKICEAPLQMKSNCGTFLIDDFGRQRMAPIELLNRWIVPLEKRYDFLRLPNGKQIRVPFDQLILFSTNLEPKDLVDEAFLRRIPYKINASDPTEAMFRRMIEIFAPKLGFREIDQASVDHLIEHHYRRINRPFRCCQPRDLLLQVKNYCIYNDLPLEMKPEYFDFAAENYFTVL